MQANHKEHKTRGYQLNSEADMLGLCVCVAVSAGAPISCVTPLWKLWAKLWEVFDSWQQSKGPQNFEPGGYSGQVGGRDVIKTFGFWWNHFASSNFYRSTMGPQDSRPDRWGRCEGYELINLGKKCLNCFGSL